MENTEQVKQLDAISLRKLGYDELCSYCYDIVTGKLHNRFNRNSVNSKAFVSAPDIDDAIMWLQATYSFNLVPYEDTYRVSTALPYNDLVSGFIDEAHIVPALISLGKKIDQERDKTPDTLEIELWVNTRDRRLQTLIRGVHSDSHNLTNWYCLGVVTAGNWDNFIELLRETLIDELTDEQLLELEQGF